MNFLQHMEKGDLIDCLKVYMANGTAIGLISLSGVKDFIAIILGLVSIASTLIIIRNNLRRNKDNDANPKQ